MTTISSDMLILAADDITPGNARVTGHPVEIDDIYLRIDRLLGAEGHFQVWVEARLRVERFPALSGYHALPRSRHPGGYIGLSAGYEEDFVADPDSLASRHAVVFVDRLERFADAIERVCGVRLDRRDGFALREAYRELAIKATGVDEARWLNPEELEIRVCDVKAIEPALDERLPLGCITPPDRIIVCQGYAGDRRRPGCRPFRTGVHGYAGDDGCVHVNASGVDQQILIEQAVLAASGRFTRLDEAVVRRLEDEATHLEQRTA